MRLKDESKKLAIYHAAIEVVNTDGVEKASMSKIARLAKVSPSTIYVYFDNKSDMINKLYLMVKRETSLAMFKNLNGKLDVEEAGRTWKKNFFHYLINNPAKLSFLEQFYQSPSIYSETEEEARSYFAPLRDLYERSVKEGKVKKYPLPVVRAFSFDPIMSLARIHLSGELEIDDELLEQALDISHAALQA